MKEILETGDECKSNWGKNVLPNLYVDFFFVKSYAKKHFTIELFFRFLDKYEWNLIQLFLDPWTEVFWIADLAYKIMIASKTLIVPIL